MHKCNPVLRRGTKGTNVYFSGAQGGMSKDCVVNFNDLVGVKKARKPR